MIHVKNTDNQNYVPHTHPILLTRVSCRPPSNGVSKKVFVIAIACSSLTNRAGMQRILALLCWRAKRAISSVQHIAARIPAYLFAVIATPFADPQINTPILPF
jgi:hypothetical protein